MKRILVIEDNETNMYLIDFILRKSEYEVIEARTGEEGVELAIKDKPDAMTGDKEKALKAGCTGYIEKPINPETFIGEIEKFF
jgi:CheY-like chemotaxis protein